MGIESSTPLTWSWLSSLRPRICLALALAASLGLSTTCIVCLSWVLGLPSDGRTFINGPLLSCHSNVIPVVCSSVQETEYAGLFAAARLADEERRILHNLGYSQPPTLLLCDNEYAVGLASKTMTPRLSKSIDMRFHWLQDRIQRGQFRVQHVAGDVNIADFFTKALAAPHQARPICTVLCLGSCSSRQRAIISSSVCSCM